MAVDFAWLSLHDSSSPEITRERPLNHIRVGHQEVAVPAPIGTPGVTADELLLRVVVADRRDSVASKHRFSRLRHRYVAGLGLSLAKNSIVAFDLQSDPLAPPTMVFLERNRFAQVERHDGCCWRSLSALPSAWQSSLIAFWMSL